MSLLEVILDLVGLIEDVWFGKRYGFGSFLWDLASFACLVIAFLFFWLDLNVLGVIGILGAVACSVCGTRRAWRDIKRTREEQTKKAEDENASARNRKND